MNNNRKKNDGIKIEMNPTSTLPVGQTSSANSTNVVVETARMSTNDSWAEAPNSRYIVSTRHSVTVPAFIFSEVMPDYTTHGLNFLASIITDDDTLNKFYPGHYTDAEIGNIRQFRSILCYTVTSTRNTLQDYPRYNTAEADIWLSDMQYAQCVYDALFMMQTVTPVDANENLNVNSMAFLISLREISLALALRMIALNRCLNGVTYEGQIDGIGLEAQTGAQLASISDGMLDSGLARLGELKKESNRIAIDTAMGSHLSLTSLLKSISFRGMPKYK